MHWRKKSCLSHIAKTKTYQICKIHCQILDTCCTQKDESNEHLQSGGILDKKVKLWICEKLVHIRIVVLFHFVYLRGHQKIPHIFSYCICTMYPKGQYKISVNGLISVEKISFSKNIQSSYFIKILRLSSFIMCLFFIFYPNPM